jgi:glycosyltransferase involved in cell wall biosynthesis
MRRGKALREHRSKLLARRKVLSIAERRRISQDKADKRKRSHVVNAPSYHGSNVQSNDSIGQSDRRVIKNRSRLEQQKRRIANKTSKSRISQVAILPSSSPLKLEFKHYNDYTPNKHINICHVIESFGMGGAQTMMMELFNGLNKYFGEFTTNHLVGITRNGKIALAKTLVNSYGCKANMVESQNFHQYLTENCVDVVLHHRIAVSSCLKKYIPEKCKYVLLNHTWNSMNRVRGFTQCDAYVSVCKFLHDRTIWLDAIHPTRRIIILNGIENDYISSIEPFGLSGEFKTGRCHRLVSGKFRIDSLSWMDKKIHKIVPGFSHHLLGSNKEARLMSPKYKSWLTYHGPIEDRNMKMSIIKDLDIYFYETFSDEGASVAILESLAAGVPVLCKKYGGCSELVVEGENGFLCRDRDIFCLRISQLAKNSKYLEEIREKTAKDFDARLHVRHTACKYAQLFESVVDAK